MTPSGAPGGAARRTTRACARFAALLALLPHAARRWARFEQYLQLLEDFAARRRPARVRSRRGREPPRPFSATVAAQRGAPPRRAASASRRAPRPRRRAGPLRCVARLARRDGGDARGSRRSRPAGRLARRRRPAVPLERRLHERALSESHAPASARCSSQPRATAARARALSAVPCPGVERGAGRARGARGRAWLWTRRRPTRRRGRRRRERRGRQRRRRGGRRRGRAARRARSRRPARPRCRAVAGRAAARGPADGRRRRRPRGRAAAALFAQRWRRGGERWFFLTECRGASRRRARGAHVAVAHEAPTAATRRADGRRAAAAVTAARTRGGAPARRRPAARAPRSRSPTSRRGCRRRASRRRPRALLTGCSRVRFNVRARARRLGRGAAAAAGAAPRAWTSARPRGSRLLRRFELDAYGAPSDSAPSGRDRVRREQRRDRARRRAARPPPRPRPPATCSSRPREAAIEWAPPRRTACASRHDRRAARGPRASPAEPAGAQLRGAARARRDARRRALTASRPACGATPRRPTGICRTTLKFVVTDGDDDDAARQPPPPRRRRRRRSRRLAPGRRTPRRRRRRGDCAAAAAAAAAAATAPAAPAAWVDPAAGGGGPPVQAPAAADAARIRPLAVAGRRDRATVARTRRPWTRSRRSAYRRGRAARSASTTAPRRPWELSTAPMPNRPETHVETRPSSERALKLYDLMSPARARKACAYGVWALRTLPSPGPEAKSRRRRHGRSRTGHEHAAGPAVDAWLVRVASGCV